MKQLIIMLAGILLTGIAGAQNTSITTADLAGKWQADSVVLKVYDQATHQLIREAVALAKDTVIKMPRVLPVELDFNNHELVANAQDGSGLFGEYKIEDNKIFFVKKKVVNARETEVKEELLEVAEWSGTGFYAERGFYYNEPATGKRVKAFYRCHFSRK